MSEIVKLSDIEIYTITSCKASNAVDSAIKMNPTNYATSPLIQLYQTISIINDASKNDFQNSKTIENIFKNTNNVPNNFIPPLTVIKSLENNKPNYQITNGWYHNWGIIHQMIRKFVFGPPDLCCASGISFAFRACNSLWEITNQQYKIGDFPQSASSQLITEQNFKGKENIILLKPNEDYAKDGKGYLTESGLKKLEKLKNWKGAVFSFTNPSGTGHIGMILGFELIKEPISQKYRCWLYTLEFNTKTSSAKDLKVVENPDTFVQQILAEPGINYYNYTELLKNPKYKLKIPTTGLVDEQYDDGAGKGDERKGGKLAFRLRLIGGDGDPDPIRTTLGNTGIFPGGSWAKNGLGEDNTYLSIGNWKKNKIIFEV